MIPSEEMTLAESFYFTVLRRKIADLSNSELIDLLIKMKLVAQHNRACFLNRREPVHIDIKSITEFEVCDFSLLQTEILMKGELKDVLPQCNKEQLLELCDAALDDLILIEKLRNQLGVL